MKSKKGEKSTKKLENVEIFNVNSNEFNAKLYFSKSLKSQTMDQLNAEDNSLKTEIMLLDNDMQSLIYDNYSNFLGASEIVRSFGKHVDILNTEMRNLENNMTEIASNSIIIEKELQPNNEKIQRLVGISRLLDRVKFISQLPMKLKSCLSDKKYREAVTIWKKIEKILRNQQHITSFSRIHVECSKIMVDIESMIRESMVKSDCPVLYSIELAELLIQIGTPASTVSNQIIHHMVLIFESNLEDSNVPSEPFSALSYLKELLIDDICVFVKEYKGKIVPYDAKTLRNLELFCVQFFQTISPYLPIKNLFDLDCNKIASYLRLFQDLFVPISSDSVVSKHIHYLLLKYTRSRGNSMFSKLEQQFKNESPIEQYIQYLNNLITETIEEFRILDMMEYKECNQFLIEQVHQLFIRLFQLFVNSVDKLALRSTIISIRLSDNEIPRIYSSLMRIENDNTNTHFGAEIIELCRSSASDCLWNYIKMQRSSIDSILLFVDMTNLCMREPIKPSPIASLCLTKLLDIFQEVSGVLNNVKLDRIISDSSPRRTRSNHSASISPSNNTPSFFGLREEGIFHIDRLFNTVNRLELSKKPRIDVKSVFGQIVTYSLKSFLENVRNSLFSPQGFNQVQVDSYYLYVHLKDKVYHSSIFIGLIEEIVTTAGDRTIDPKPLTNAVLKSIIESINITD